MGEGGLCCKPYSAGILHSVSDQIQNLPNCFTTPNKMTSEDDIKGLVSLKFLRPWDQSSYKLHSGVLAGKFFFFFLLTTNCRTSPACKGLKHF